MRTKAASIGLTLVLSALSAGHVPLAAQSLADVARQEQDRRKTIKKPSKVLTNKDLTAVPSTTPSGSAAAVPAAGTASGSDAGKTTGGTENKPDEAGKDQAYWSGRMKDLQTQLDRDQTFAVALQSRINALTTQYTNQGDPAQQAALATDRQKAITELNRLTKAIEDDKKALADLQEEARRSGVPAGWLR